MTKTTRLIGRNLIICLIAGFSLPAWAEEGEEDRLDVIEAQQGAMLDHLDQLLGAPKVTGVVGLRSHWVMGLGERFSPQVQARIALHGKPADGWAYGLRLSTSPTSLPNWSWIDFSDNMAAAAIGLDRFFLSWKPLPSITLLAGKFENPFAHSELLWDEDVQYQGLSQSWTVGDNSRTPLTLTLGQSYPGFGMGLISGQAKLLTGWCDPLILEGSLAGHALWGRPEGNLALLNATAAATWIFSPALPLSVKLDYAQNMAAADDRQGLWLSLTLGRILRPGDWQVGYRYKRLEDNLTLAQWTEEQMALGSDAHEVLAGVEVFDQAIIATTVQFRQDILRQAGSSTTFRTYLMRFF